MHTHTNTHTQNSLLLSLAELPTFYLLNFLDGRRKKKRNNILFIIHVSNEMHQHSLPKIVWKGFKKSGTATRVLVDGRFARMKPMLCLSRFSRVCFAQLWLAV